jgi:serine protease Do
LFDDTGRLIGIVNAKTIDEEVENIGYALPSNVVKAVADNIIDFCYGKNCASVMRPILGVTITTTESKAEYTENGVFIRETIVIHEVSAGQIGSVFHVDDELVSMTLNGVTKMISQRHHVIDTMITSRPGDVVDFVIIRDGKQMTVSVTITDGCLTAY